MTETQPPVWKVNGFEFKVLPKMHGKWSGVHNSVSVLDLTGNQNAGTTRISVEEDKWTVKSTETDKFGNTKVQVCSFLPDKDGHFRVDFADHPSHRGLVITGWETPADDSITLEFHDRSGTLIGREDISVHNDTRSVYIREFDAESGSLKGASVWVERKVSEADGKEGGEGKKGESKEADK
eukprot:CAMPEP_0177666656 /NCGR_PEP_ID=MMETSP0447-20121125/21700_1 /TAXON_ID=0 /ORGANISM="Stygamoeba regulata, Strain BSH-02190019" /LENGTH=180 /DNA_ID=CAMNT_0019172823 /DNA_START=40 /DNA_END=582 /DNA_ORIENTATION=+